MLIALSGLFLIVAAAVGAIAVGGIGPVSGTVLLLAIVVLLVVNFILLVILVRCSCRSDRRQPQELASLLTLLFPMVAQLPNALRDIAMALKKTSDAVGWIQGNINTAGTWLDSAGNVTDAFSIPIPTVLGHRLQTVHADGSVHDDGAWVFDGIDPTRAYYPLGGIKAHLDGAGADLLRRTGPGGELDQVTTVLKATASVVGLLANGLGASPPAPAEVTQP